MKHKTVFEPNIGANVDIGIIYIVRLLNKLDGITTLYSCENDYGFCPKCRARRAYVVFRCENIEDLEPIRRCFGTLKTGSFCHQMAAEIRWAPYKRDTQRFVLQIPKDTLQYWQDKCKRILDKTLGILELEPLWLMECE